MPYSRNKRRPPVLNALLWFLPAWACVAVATLGAHPLALIPLLLANPLAMAATCHAIGFDAEPSVPRAMLRRGAAYLVLFTAYSALLLALIAWPLVWLMRAPSLDASLLLSVALMLALAALWRLWPAFGLLFLWDDAYPDNHERSWIFAALARSIAFGRHLARERDHFFGLFLPVSLSLLLMAFGALALTGLYGVLPPELRIVALGVYGLVLLPACCLMVANRTLRALLCGRRRAARAQQAEAHASQQPETECGPVSDVTPYAPLAAPGPAALDQANLAPDPDLDRQLLAAIRAGRIEQARASLEAGADPEARPEPQARDQRSPLMLASLLAATGLLRELIQRGADVNRACGGLTPLLAATRDSYHGRSEAVMTLLANGAQVQVCDVEGNTPLHYAALSGEANVAAMLLDAGAEVDALNRAGLSPLAMACRAGNWVLVRFLLERGAHCQPERGEPALVAAASVAEDDAEGVSLLLKRKARVNAGNTLGRTALLCAALEGHAEIVHALLRAGAAVNAADQRGTTALMEAARAGAREVMEILAEHDPDPALRDAHGRDALTLACQSPRCDAECIKALLALGADPRARASNGRTPLDHAAAAGRWNLVALLDPETPLPSAHDIPAGAHGADTPAHLLDALRFGHWSVVAGFEMRVRSWSASELAGLYLQLAAPGLTESRRWLLDHGLPPDARQASGKRLFEALSEQLPHAREALGELLGAGASAAGAGGLARTMARLDRAEGAEDLLQLMLQRGADPFGADSEGRTPLLHACTADLPRIVDAMLEIGCDPNPRDGDGQTPLHAALGHPRERALPLLRRLIAHGADPECAAANGETALGVALARADAELERWLRWDIWPLPRRPLRASDLPAAAALGDTAAVQRLLALHTDVDTRDAQGATALMRACGGGHHESAQVLLEAGAQPALDAPSGATCLSAAISAHRPELVMLLLERGAKVDQRLAGETTALMVAAALGHADIADILLAAGADANAVDQHGQSALHAAARYCFASRDSLRARRLLDVLLGDDAHIDACDNDGSHALLLLLGAHAQPGTKCDATHLGALVPVLLDGDAPLNEVDRRGVSALHACAMHALLAPARLLLARGADRDACDGLGRTAADIARMLGYIDVAHELGPRSIPGPRQTLRREARPE